MNKPCRPLTVLQIQTTVVEAELNPDDKYMILTICQIMKMLCITDAEDSSPEWAETYRDSTTR